MSATATPGMGGIEIWDLHASLVFKRWLYKHEKHLKDV